MAHVAQLDRCAFVLLEQKRVFVGLGEETPRHLATEQAVGVLGKRLVDRFRCTATYEYIMHSRPVGNSNAV